MPAKEPSVDDSIAETLLEPASAPSANLAERPEPHRSPTPNAVRPIEKPLLMVDIDGVISLFGLPGFAFAPNMRREGLFHSIDGILHFLSTAAAAHLLALAEDFDLVWASGWEEKAEEYLPRLLGLPAELPFLRFDRARGAGTSLSGHWKLDAIDAYAGTRPLAWIDDAFDESCRTWAAARPAPTLLVPTIPADGLTSREALLLKTWARKRARAGMS